MPTSRPTDPPVDATLRMELRRQARAQRLLAVAIAFVALNCFVASMQFFLGPHTASGDDPISLALGAFRAATSSYLRRRQFTVDILSVSSVNNTDLLDAQRSTFGAHPSVRHFFNATELDDADPDCHKVLTWDDVVRVSNFCRRKKKRVPARAGTEYAHPEWLEKKENPAGWLCAQVRPLSGLQKVYQHYAETGEALPDFLIVMDDDTYYDMEQFERNFAEMNSSDAMYYAGCLIRSPVGWPYLNFTQPLGGFGSILSMGTLENLFRPMNCPSFGAAVGSEAAPQYSSKEICDRLDEDLSKERQYFRNGMNLVELMYAYSSTPKYRDASSWTSSTTDWALGYFMNFYYVSRHVAPATKAKDAWMDSAPHMRIEAYKGSEIYSEATGICKQDCHALGPRGGRNRAEICHRATPEWMREETEWLVPS